MMSFATWTINDAEFWKLVVILRISPFLFKSFHLFSFCFSFRPFFFSRIKRLFENHNNTRMKFTVVILTNALLYAHIHTLSFFIFKSWPSLFFFFPFHKMNSKLFSWIAYIHFVNQVARLIFTSFPKSSCLLEDNLKKKKNIP